VGDAFLQFLRDLEDGDAPRRQRDRVTGPWIPGSPRLPGLYLEGPEAADFDVMPVPQGFLDARDELVHGLADVFLGEARLFGYLRNQARLGPGPPSRSRP